jgi:hypothetical protein
MLGRFRRKFRRNFFAAPRVYIEMPSMKIALALALAAALPCTNTLRADNPVIVHEWGTFTSLQDENGKAIGGINVDDEPVPSFVYNADGVEFVHNLPGAGSGNIYGFGLPPYPAQKGWRPADQDVTMRLETPVIYFYPPKGNAPSSALPLTVRVDFHGGLLSQFYPYAETKGFPNMMSPWQAIHLSDCTSSLTWTVTHFGSAQQAVETSDKVWTTPREVSAPEIEVKAKVVDGGQWVDTTQAEHFLFYRGVGHLDSPVSLNLTSLDAKQRENIFGWIHRTMTTSASFDALVHDSSDSNAWLAEIRPDGTCRWEVLPLTQGMKLAGKFVTHDFSPDNLTKLKSSMQTALVQAGLYPDEASAMLRTWELSYFKSPGLRFFYIVPRAWVDNELPLKITGAPVDVTRVMVGRIELISDEQKATLARLKQEGPPDLVSIKQAAYDALQSGKFSKKEQAEFESGARPLTDLGLTLSPGMRDYLSLGRFRDALIAHEQAERPSDSLARFIKDNDLAAR